MTVIRCKKHGFSGFIESCKHVHDLINIGRSDEVKTIRAYIYSMIVCMDCIERYELEKYVIDPNHEYDIFGEDTEIETDEYWEKFKCGYHHMENRIGWCSECIYELLSKPPKNT